MLRISAGGYELAARLEEADAPDTVAAFRRLLPLASRIIHVRWSGEAGWIPFGDLDLGLGPENATCYPHPGEIVLYPGGVSETEILLAYGYVNFASKAGQLAGNHFATIVEGNEHLRDARQEVPLGGRAGDRLPRGLSFPALRGPFRPLALAPARAPRAPIARSHGAIPFDLKTTMSVSACRPGSSPDTIWCSSCTSSQSSCPAAIGLDQVAGLETGVLDRVAADDRRTGDHLRVELARARIVGPDRADERAVGEPVAAQHGVLGGRRGDHDVAAAGLRRGFRDVCAVGLRERLGPLARAAGDDDALDRRHRGSDRGELRLRLPAGTDQPEARGPSPREVLRRDPARGACPHLAQPVGGDHRDERPVREVEQADDELDPALHEEVALQPGNAEAAVGGGHHGEIAALDREAAPRHQLDLPCRHAPEAVLDHRHRLARRHERPRRPPRRARAASGRVYGAVPPAVAPAVLSRRAAA